MSERDCRALLAGERFCDAKTQASFETHGEPLEDFIVQIREGVSRSCTPVERWRIRSHIASVSAGARHA